MVDKEKKYYWIKLKNTFMTSDSVDFLMSQKNGSDYVVLYQMLCLLSINTNGELERKVGEIIIPYDAEKIQRDCKYFKIDTVVVALGLYKKLGLIYEQNDGSLRISNFDNLVGGETKWAEKKRITRSNGFPKIVNGGRRINKEMFKLSNGETKYIDENRYGGNGALCYDLANYKCELCGKDSDLVIHHNNGFSNKSEDLFLLCKSCHGKVESNSIMPIHSSEWWKLSTPMSATMSTPMSDKRIEIRDKTLELEKEKDISKKVSKEEKPTNKNFNTIISEYTLNDKLKNTILEFIKMRQRIRKPLTNYALQLILGKLDKITNDDYIKIQILNQSIQNSWQGIFELKEQYKEKSISNSKPSSKYDEE